MIPVQELERRCNQVATDLLVPLEPLRDTYQTLNVANALSFRDDAGIRQHFPAELDTLFILRSPHASF